MTLSVGRADYSKLETRRPANGAGERRSRKREVSDDEQTPRFAGAGTDRWHLGIYCRNLFNAYYWSSFEPATDTVFRSARMPRTYGGRLTFNF